MKKMFFDVVVVPRSCFNVDLFCEGLPALAFGWLNVQQQR